MERVSPQDAARLRRIIEPLAKAADRPPAQVTVGILADKSVNAANAGNGEFYVTRGLLDRANDEQLHAVLAHEFAHNDLGHVAKAQRLQTGVELGSAILEQVIPNSAIITPIAGTLITRAYSRSEELAADKHAVTILRRVGSSKEALENTLSWLASISGGGDGGGWLATHPWHQRPHPGAPANAVTLPRNCLVPETPARGARLLDIRLRAPARSRAA